MMRKVYILDKILASKLPASDGSHPAFRFSNKKMGILGIVVVFESAEAARRMNRIRRIIKLDMEEVQQR